MSVGAYIPGPLPTDMGRHSPHSLRLAILRYDIAELERHGQGYQAYQLAERARRMTPEVPWNGKVRL